MIANKFWECFVETQLYVWLMYGFLYICMYVCMLIQQIQLIQQIEWNIISKNNELAPQEENKGRWIWKMTKHNINKRYEVFLI